MIFILFIIYCHSYPHQSIENCSNLNGFECSTTSIQYTGQCGNVSCCLSENIVQDEQCINFFDMSCSNYSCENGMFFVGIYNSNSGKIRRARRCIDFPSISLNNGISLYDNCWNADYNETIYIDYSCINQQSLITNMCKCSSCKPIQFQLVNGINTLGDKTMKPSFYIGRNSDIIYDCKCQILPSYFKGNYQYLTGVPITDYYKQINIKEDKNVKWD